MSVNDVLIRTSLAAVRSGSHIRLYETAVDGGIREIQYDGSWTGGAPRNVVATGKIGTPVAATSLGLQHIRVYYITADNRIGEAAYDSGSGWYKGGLTDVGVEVAPYSSIAAVYLGGESRIRVYAQLANDTIQEWVWDNNGKGWTVGTNLGHALPGTQIAATSWGTSSIHIRVYAQDKDLNIFEKTWDGGWGTGHSFANPVTRAALGVTSWGDGSSLGIRIYYGAPGDRIKERAWDGSGGWYDGGFDEPSIPASNVAAIPLDVLRVYFQNGTEVTALTEFAWTNSGWTTGAPALPVA